jgi:hypothetical protein
MAMAVAAAAAAAIAHTARCGRRRAKSAVFLGVLAYLLFHPGPPPHMVQAHDVPCAPEALCSVASLLATLLFCPLLPHRLQQPNQPPFRPSASHPPSSDLALWHSLWHGSSLYSCSLPPFASTSLRYFAPTCLAASRIPHLDAAVAPSSTCTSSLFGIPLHADASAQLPLTAALLRPWLLLGP